DLKTLKENNLEVKEVVLPYISARFICNKSSYKFKEQQINELVSSLKEQVEVK
ncbi:MAG: ATP phosphoribosyltransferase, partial [Bacilli bacterium]